MRKPRYRIRTGIESLETRTVPTTLVPTLTMTRLGDVAGQVGRIMGTLARDRDFDAAGSSLAALSTNIPFGRQQGLADEWRSDLATVDSSVPGSGLEAQRHMIQDLYQYVLAGVQSRSFRVTGSGADVFSRTVGSTQPVVYKLDFANDTGFAIKITGFLTASGTKTTLPLARGESGTLNLGSRAGFTGIDVTIESADPNVRLNPYHSRLLQNNGQYKVAVINPGTRQAQFVVSPA